MSELPSQLRGVVIQVAGSQLLLPNAAIAEVLAYSDPEALANAPRWLLGRVRWRGWQVPLVDFSQLTGAPAIAPGGMMRRRVLVAKALGHNPRLPYIAFMADGFPRLMSMSPASVETLADSADPDRCVFARVVVNEEPAVVPDMDAIEARIVAELQQAA